MSAWDWFRVMGIFGPIVAMLLLGFVLTVRSGVARLNSTTGMKRAFENVSEAVVLLGGCLVGLALIHHLVGQRVALIGEAVGPATMPIYIDGDACPVKDEVYRVARRYEMDVIVVANASIFVPTSPRISMVTVKGHMNAADDWIVEHAELGDIVITSDIPLADRLLKKSVRVLGPKGNLFTEETIGEALATRALLDHLRQTGVMGGGPSPFAKTDRSRFLAKLDETIQAIRRGTRPTGR